MPINDQLGQRMKTYYEEIPKTKLMRRTPVAIRIDGKAFHTFTKGFQKPFDEVLVKSMQRTMKYLCKNIQGCVLGYCESDEITLILQDYAKLTTDAWFDYEVQKMCSIAASMATMAFNRIFEDEINEYCSQKYQCSGIREVLIIYSIETLREVDNVLVSYLKSRNNGAMFDARCFNIPKEEVANLIYWRQLDATRNSIQMVGQAYFSHKELEGKSCNQIQDMLHEQIGINWNDYPTHLKRGSCCIKVPISEKNKVETVETIWGESHLVEKTIRRYAWKIDTEIPIFKGDDREYIEKWIWM